MPGESGRPTLPSTRCGVAGGLTGPRPMRTRVSFEGCRGGFSLTTSLVSVLHRDPVVTAIRRRAEVRARRRRRVTAMPRRLSQRRRDGGDNLGMRTIPAISPYGRPPRSRPMMMSTRPASASTPGRRPTSAPTTRLDRVPSSPHRWRGTERVLRQLNRMFECDVDRARACRAPIQQGRPCRPPRRASTPSCEHGLDEVAMLRWNHPRSCSSEMSPPARDGRRGMTTSNAVRRASRAHRSRQLDLDLLGREPVLRAAEAAGLTRRRQRRDSGRRRRSGTDGELVADPVLLLFLSAMCK